MTISSDPVWVGIDSAKATIDVAIGPTGPVTTYANTDAGHRTLLTQLATVACAGIVLDATGAYHLALVGTVQAAGHLPSASPPTGGAPENGPRTIRRMPCSWRTSVRSSSP